MCETFPVFRTHKGVILISLMTYMGLLFYLDLSLYFLKHANKRSIINVNNQLQSICIWQVHNVILLLSTESLAPKAGLFLVNYYVIIL